MNVRQRAEARQMLGDDESKSVVCLAEDVERIVEGRLAKCLGLSGSQVGAIASAVRRELRDQIDAAVFEQRTLKIRQPYL